MMDGCIVHVQKMPLTLSEHPISKFYSQFMSMKDYSHQYGGISNDAIMLSVKLLKIKKEVGDEVL